MIKTKLRLNLELIGKIFLYIILWVALLYVAELLGSAPWASLIHGTENGGLAMPSIFGGLLHLVVVGLGTVALTVLFRLGFDRKSFKGMALGFQKRSLVLFLMGFGGGLVLMGSVFVVEDALGWIRILSVGSIFDSSSTLNDVFGSLLFMGTTALAEELAFRGYIFQNLAERYTLLTATVVSGLIFGALHFLGGVTFAGWTFIISALLLTFMLVLSRLITGSLWLAIGYHFSWDWLVGSVLGLQRSAIPHSQNPGILSIVQSGPPFWVGVPPNVEGGWLYILSTFVGIAALLVYARCRKVKISWGSRLSPRGEMMRTRLE